MIKLRSTVVLLLALLTCAPPAYSFRSVNFESFTDPDYQGYTPRKIILLVANASNETRRQIEVRLAQTFRSKNVVLVPYRDLFPPTRAWTKEEQLAVYEREQVDSGLIITVGASSSQVIPIATQTYGSANVFGSYGTQGTFSGSANSTSTSYNIVSARSTAEFSAILLDLRANRTVWYADVTTKASGTIFVGAKGDAKALVKGVINGLTKDGHLQRK